MAESQKPRKPGFRLKSLPEDAYKGQQQRIKNNLIQKAKLKKNYAKVLKQEARNHPPTSVVHPSTEVQQSRADGDDSVANEAAADDFTAFGDEDSATGDPQEGDGSGDGLPSKQIKGVTHPSSHQSGSDAEHKSYRQRVRERKNDPAAAKAYEIKAERERERQLAAAKRAQIEKKRENRTVIKKREMSRTRKGQPLMKDRMRNILDKLQTDV